GLDPGQPQGRERAHRVADHVDGVEAEVVEEGLYVAHHGVVGVGLGVVGLGRPAVAARVERDHATARGHDRIGDAGPYPVDRAVGREAVEEDDRWAFTLVVVDEAQIVERVELGHADILGTADLLPPDDGLHARRARLWPGLRIRRLHRRPGRVRGGRR